MVQAQQDINARNIEDETALHLAVHSPEVVPLLIYASSGPGIGLPPRYLQPGSMTFRLPYDLAFNGGCLIDLAQQQVLLQFEVDRDGWVLPVQPRGSSPTDDALNTLLQAAREFRFPQKYVEWEARPYITVVALPLPSRGCWYPPLHEAEQRGFGRMGNSP